MDVVNIYDYYFYSEPHRKYDDRCEYNICEKSIVYRRLLSSVEELRLADGGETEEGGLHDVLEYMLYNVSGDTGLPAYYSCCMLLYKRTTSGHGDTSCYTESGHVCNAIPIMIGSRLEKKIVARLADMLGVRLSLLYDADYLHTVYAGSFLVNGIFYYSVFRESNNNKILHNTNSKYRGEETVAYFYDNTCNRGVKLFTNRPGDLVVNDRDGNEVTSVTADVMLQLYKECLHNWHNYTLDMSLIKGLFAAVKKHGLAGIDTFKNKIYTNYSIGLNTFLDKLPADAMSNAMWNSSLMVGKINLGISQRLIYPKTKSETKKLNEQKLKMCTGGMSTGYLVETQRRRNVRKMKTTVAAAAAAATVIDNPIQTIEEMDVDGQNCVHVSRSSTKSSEPGAKPEGEAGVGCCSESASGRKRTRFTQDEQCGGTVAAANNNKRRKVRPSRNGGCEPATAATHTILGSKDVKTGGLMEKLEQGDHNGPSTFNQVSVSYLPLIRVLSSTVQKLQVEHVHAESSKTVPRDAYGFICMKYMGNISTAGKNMLFAERVEVSYGHVHTVVEAVESGLEDLASQRSDDDCDESTPFVERRHQEGGGGEHINTMYLVINNAVTVWSVSRKRLLDFMIFVKTRCHRFVWTKIVGDYFCIYYYEGVPLLRFQRGEMMFDLLAANVVGVGRQILLEDSGGGVNSLYFSRDELETLALTDFFKATATTAVPTDAVGKQRLVDKTNTLLENWFMVRSSRGGYTVVEHSSLLAKHLDQYTGYTAPAKRSVSVNARKSAHINVYYQRAADLIRGFNIFADPEAYERSTAKLVASTHGLPEWVTLRDFTRARAQLANCPQPVENEDWSDGGTSDKSLENFYMFRTIFADVAGCNVEDANVLDESVDLNLSYSYSFSLTFVDKTKGGLDIVVPPPRNAVCVCCWDSHGNPTTVLFVVCMIRAKDSGWAADGYGGVAAAFDDVGEMLRLSSEVRMVDDTPAEAKGTTTTTSGAAANSKTPPPRPSPPQSSSFTDDEPIRFPPFRKLSVIRSGDGNYHVYFMRNDAVLLRSIQRLRRERGMQHPDQPRPNMSNATRLAEGEFAFTCKPEVNPYDALTSLRTRIMSFGTSDEERVVTVDVRVHGRSDKYDGVKVVNAFGQKGLALIKDLRPYFAPGTPASHNVPVQLVMNNCSFVSRQPIGQYLQMKTNMFAVTTSAGGEQTSVGYTPVFFTETEPITKTCLVRFDEMMRSVIVTLGLTVFQNVKSSLDNVYNPYGVICPPQTRQIMGLYRCVGVSFNFSGDNHAPFSSRDEVNSLIDVYEEYSRITKPKKVSGSGALLEVSNALDDERGVRRLLDTGLLEEICADSRATATAAAVTRKTYFLHLNGQWMFGERPVRRDPAAHHHLLLQKQADYELHTYSSRDDCYRTIYIFGDPRLIAAAVTDDHHHNIIHHRGRRKKIGEP